jgi:hypothetical protein
MTATAKGTPRTRPSQRARTVPAAVPAAPPRPVVLRFTSEPAEAAEQVPEEREPLFYIDDVEYTIPVNPSSVIGREALHIMAEHGGGPVGMTLADDYIMTMMLGVEGFSALRSCKTLKKGDYPYLVSIITERAMGALEEDNPNP